MEGHFAIPNAALQKRETWAHMQGWAVVLRLELELSFVSTPKLH